MLSKKKKRTLVYKPYYKGNIWFGAGMVKNALKVFCYFLFFCIMYTIVGAALSFDSFILRLICNGLVLFVCLAVIYTKGLAQGQEDVALGEIVYTRLEEGKPVEESEKKQSYRMIRGWVIFLMAIIPVLAITVPAALTAERQVYINQAMPSWLSSFETQEEIYQPLVHQTEVQSKSFTDILQLISRILILPYVGIFTTENKDTLLLLERLAPVLAILPGLAYPVGYMMGPYARAIVHGDIDQNKKKQKRRQNKMMKQKKAQRANENKQNELI